MLAENVDVVSSLAESRWTFVINTELWEDYLSENHEVDWSKLVKIPFFANNSSVLSDEVKKIPNNCGGIYIYSLENPIIPAHGNYIMYVGRARLTKYENLRQRAKSHFSDYQRGDENERLTRLYDGWAKYVYFSYVPIDTNEAIDKAEKDLIVHLCPPCNKDYPSVSIRKKLSAFQYS